MSKELLKQALEYLEDNQHWVADGERHAYVMEYNAFIDKLKQALAQPDAVMQSLKDLKRSVCDEVGKATLVQQKQEPAYYSSWELIKDGAMKIALEGAANYIDVLGGDSRKYRQVLAQPEQNTVQRLSALVRAQQITIDKLEAQPEQEPVAWMYPDDHERMTTSETFCTVYSVEVGSATRGESSVALYTTPPQRKPLTDEEIDELSRSMVKGDKSVNWLCRAIEAAHGIQEDK